MRHFVIFSRLHSITRETRRNRATLKSQKKLWRVRWYRHPGSGFWWPDTRKKAQVGLLDVLSGGGAWESVYRKLISPEIKSLTTLASGSVSLVISTLLVFPSSQASAEISITKHIWAISSRVGFTSPLSIEPYRRTRIGKPNFAACAQKCFCPLKPFCSRKSLNRSCGFRCIHSARILTVKI